MPTVPLTGRSRRIASSALIRPGARRTWSPSPSRTATPAESYPRYSSRFSPSRIRPTASLSPTYPTMPHIDSALLAARPAALGPAVLDDLLGAPDGEGARRDVPGDRGAGADVGALADREGRHQARVRADKRAVPDAGLVLGDAVVVAGDRPGADVHRLADGRVADVGEMRHLRPPADRRFLQLDEVADLGVRPHVREGPQVAERSEDGPRLDDRLRQHAVGQERDPVAEPAPVEVAAGADDALGAHPGLPLEHDPRLEHRVRTDLHRVVDVGRGGVEDGDPLGHQPVEGPLALERGDRRALLAVVYPEALGGIGGRDGLDARPRAGEDPDHVRQVVLALLVARGDLGQGRPEPPRVEAVDARVDLADPLLVVGRVPVLDDAADVPALPQHAPVSCRTLDERGEKGHRRAGLRVVVDQPGDGRLGEERRVAGQDDDRAVPPRRPRLLDGLPRAEALGLLRELDPRPGGGAHLRGLAAGAHHDAVAERPRQA